MSELYELHLARLQGSGVMEEGYWGPQSKSGKRTGDGGQPPPANGGANTSGGKGQSARFAAGKGKGKKRPLPPWMTEKGKGSKADWGREASSTEHESYRKPRGRDNHLQSRMTSWGPHDQRTDVRRARGDGVADAHANDSRVNRVHREDFAQGIPKPGTGGPAGNPYTPGRSGNGYDTGTAGGSRGTGTPGNVRKRRPHSGTGGTQAGNPYLHSRSPAEMGTPRPANVHKSVYDFSAEEIADAMAVLNKAMNGVLADYEDFDEE